MKSALTIAELAKHYNRDRSTILRWIERELFPNALLVESPLGNYWVVPSGDLKNFDEPKAGRPRKQSQLKAA